MGSAICCSKSLQPPPLPVRREPCGSKRTFAPRPNYTEEARRARVQGVVILQAVVDAVGNVGYVKVLKGLPEGLTESAVQVVEQWRYEPATLNGEPVPVYINLTVNFSLQ
ncbi:MAG: energy transducer TonB [Acidobacteria bacterium]|nr:energy transducer TonB [Acidobacteriota bacterium]